MGRIVFKGDNSDPDNIEPDVVKHYYSMPDDMDINDTESGEPQVDVEFPGAAEIASIKEKTKQTKLEAFKVQSEQNHNLFLKATDHLIFAPFFCIFSCGREGRFIPIKSLGQPPHVPFNIFGNSSTCSAIAEGIQPF